MRPNCPRCSGLLDVWRRRVGSAVPAMTCGALGETHAVHPDDRTENVARTVDARHAAYGLGLSITRPGGTSVCAPAPLDTLAEAASDPAGGVGPIDRDPLCACRDFGDLRLEIVGAAPAGVGRRTAQVAFADAGSRGRPTLSLVRTLAGWRADDVGVLAQQTVAAVRRAAIGAELG